MHNQIALPYTAVKQSVTTLMHFSNPYALATISTPPQRKVKGMIETTITMILTKTIFPTL